MNDGPGAASGLPERLNAPISTDELERRWRALREAMERRIHAHGQGYDLVERPLVRFDETMHVEAGMNFACRPAYVVAGFFAWICDNWLVGPDRPGERLHAVPQEIVSLG